MKILYIGPNYGNAYLQYLSLKKLFKKVDKIDPVEKFRNFDFYSIIFYHISPIIFENLINKFVLDKIDNKYDLIYVRSAEFIGKRLILKLKKKTKKIVYFCNDNPFTKRDNKRWVLFISAIKFYDLLVFQDQSRIKYCKELNLKKILLTIPPYDKKIHKKIKISYKKKLNRVVFVGTWSKTKGYFIYNLLKLGLKIDVYGTRWHKDENYIFMKKNINQGNFTYKKYSKIISRYKIALALYTEGNEDTITARSIEIPAIGTCLFSKKTNTMKKLFKEGREVIFFKDYNECYSKCLYYLNNYKKLDIISKNAHKKVTKKLKINNEDLIKKIINKIR